MAQQRIAPEGVDGFGAVFHQRSNVAAGFCQRSGWRHSIGFGFGRALTILMMMAVPATRLMGGAQGGEFGVLEDADVRLEIRRLPVLRIEGTPGPVLLEYSTDLAHGGPWAWLTTITLGEGPFVYVDDHAEPNECRFYRAVSFASQFVQPPPPVVPGMVFVRPGTFVMGSGVTERGRCPDEGPLTLVTLSQGFWLAKHEVTQREYEALLAFNPSEFSGDPARPVERVSWEEAVRYCALLTRHEWAVGRLPVGYEYRLPTEAQWEYACRAGTVTAYSFGDDPVLLGEYGWFAGNSGGATHPVGQKKPNPWGLYDMHGNVWEWCADWYGDRYNGGAVDDPQGPASPSSKPDCHHLYAHGNDRCGRGASWSDPAAHCRSASRGGDGADHHHSACGFRVALVPVR
jgi:formylglycine-generating enzyme required for sulfatase activity